MSQLSVVLTKVKVSKGKETPDCGRAEGTEAGNDKSKNKQNQ